MGRFIGLEVGLDLLRSNPRRFARHTLVTTFLTALIFSMIVMNSSFNATFNDIRTGLNAGPLVLDKTGIHQLLPGETTPFNTTQLPINDDVFRKVISPMRDAYFDITVVIAALIFWTQGFQCFKDAKQDSEEFSGTMGTMYAMKARPEWIYTAFMLNGLLSHALGLVAGTLLASYAILPFVMSYINQTPAAPFFQNLNPVYGVLASAMFITLNLAIRSAITARAVTEKSLLSATVG